MHQSMLTDVLKYSSQSVKGQGLKPSDVFRAQSGGLPRGHGPRAPLPALSSRHSAAKSWYRATIAVSTQLCEEAI